MTLNRKNYSVLAFISLICLLIINISAGNIVQPVYKWKANTDYSYTIEHGIGLKKTDPLYDKLSTGKKNPFCKFYVLNKKEDKWTIAVSINKTNSIMFISTDKYGKFTLLKISENTSTPNSIKPIVDYDFILLNNILSNWKLVQFSKKIEKQEGHVYKLQNSSKGGEETIFVNNLKNAKPYEKRVVSFGTKQGMILKQKISYEGRKDYSLISLASVNKIPEKRLEELRSTFKRALTEDEFRLKKYTPMLTQGNKWKKQKYFLALCKIKDKKELRKLFENDFIKLAGESPFLCQMVDDYLLDSAMSGEKWAMDVLVSKERYEKLKPVYSKMQIYDAFTKLQNKTGQKFGKDSAKWSSWYKSNQKDRLN